MFLLILEREQEKGERETPMGERNIDYLPPLWPGIKSSIQVLALTRNWSNWTTLARANLWTLLSKHLLCVWHDIKVVNKSRAVLRVFCWFGTFNDQFCNNRDSLFRLWSILESNQEKQSAFEGKYFNGYIIQFKLYMCYI